ncbi:MULTISPECIES: OmpW family outer membrane protein [Modicisalibacter]|uniref:OmpW/AlkL family protein n=1 Tax=Modicisalibacter TaxID=574347 RepID=UPI00100B47F9|nr:MULTISPECIES: OmpW family outer membrane protein [Halomonadaceae]MBZ9557399.1 outer membrane beta-barrel protein [Modicisalibacter sp. R2A 31.J]MBZ9573935.1 outer membrane beta-barrel protein [Modicisalibacter sp. MOD 31.J]
MTKLKLLSASLIAGGLLVASQATLAYEAGDILIRGGYAENHSDGDNDGIDINDDRAFTGSVGYMVHDKIGVTLGSSDKFDQSLSGDGVDADYSSRPIDLMVEYYPLGGLDSRIQPYAGVGANYTRFSDESNGLSIDNTWAPKGEVGVDLVVTKNLSFNGFASYADVDPDYSYAGNSGELDTDPVMVGGGVTLSF